MNRRKLHESSHGPVIKDIKTFKAAVRKTEKISPQSGKKTKGYSLIYGFKGNALFIEANSIQDAFSKYQNNYQKYDAYISDDSFLRKESTDRNKKPLLETYKKLFGETPGGKKILKEEDDDDDMGDGEDFEEYGSGSAFDNLIKTLRLDNKSIKVKNNTLVFNTTYEYGKTKSIEVKITYNSDGTYNISYDIPSGRKVRAASISYKQLINTLNAEGLIPE